MIDRIRTIMEYTKLSQQDFAARLGISPAILKGIMSRMEQGPLTGSYAREIGRAHV